MSKTKVSGHKKVTPIVVFAGRSNVGKSSTIRELTGAKVRIGKYPGSTRWELVVSMGSVDFVDIPGFGYMSKQSKTSIEEMKNQIVRWLEDWSDRMAVGVLIIDISLFREIVERWENRGEIPVDIEFYTFLSEIAPEVVVVANKVDKVKKREIDTEIQYLRDRLIESVPVKKPNIIPTAASKGIGIDKLREELEKLLKRRGIAPPDW